MKVGFISVARAATLLALVTVSSGCNDFDRIYNDCVARGVCSASPEGNPGTPNGLVSTVTVDRSTGVTADGTDAAQISVTVRDGSGIAVPGVTVRVEASGNGNTIEQPATTDPAGSCVARLRSTVAGTKTITATIVQDTGDVVIAAQPTVQFQAGPAVGLAFQSPPTDVVAGSAFVPVVAVAVVDAHGNAVPGATNPISIAIGAGAGTATLTGATTVAAIQGLASFTDLFVSTTATGLTLVASATGLGATTSAPFDVLAPVPSPTLSTVEASPASAPADGTSTIFVTVTVKNATGLPIRGMDVQLATEGGTASVASHPLTDASGVTKIPLTSTDAAPMRLVATVVVGAQSYPLSQQPVVTFTPSAPVLVVNAPTAPVSGCVPLSYIVNQQQALPVNLRVEVDSTGGGNFVRATQAGSTAAEVAGVTGVRSGSHQFLWNSTADLGRLNGTRVVRVTASAAGAPDSEAQTASVTLANGASFAAQAPLSVPPYSSRVISGDLNQDGRPDLIVMTAGNPSMFINQGDGGFTTTTTTTGPALSPYVKAIAIGDLNHDGAQDLVEFNDAGVYSLIGDGAGSFAVTANQTLGFSPEGLAVADLNRDGTLDALIGAPATSQLAYLRGLGDGGFATPSFTTAGLPPTDLAVADFDRDGMLDVLAVSGATAGGKFLHGNGNGTLAAPTAVAFNAPAHDVRAADMNRDGILDAVAATSTDVEVALGNGDGTFAAPITATLNATTSAGLSVADFDGDGVLDVAVTRPSSSSLAIFYGKGDGTLRPLVNVLLGSQLGSTSAADFDGDGHPDVAVVTNTNGGGGALYVAHTVVPPFCDPLFEGPSSGLSEFSGTAGLAVVDVNQDGKPDAVTTERFRGQVSVVLGLGNGTFGASTPYPVGALPQSLVAGQFDPDSETDLAVVNTNSNSVSVLPGATNGTFGSSTDYGVGTYPVQLVSGDLDHDAGIDLVAVNPMTGNVSVLLGNGDDTFEPARNTDAGVSPVALALADVDHDGWVDVVTANQKDLSVLLNLGDGVLAPAVHLGPVEAPKGIAAADLDGNGWADLVVCHGADAGVSIYSNDGGTLIETARYATLSPLPATPVPCQAPIIGDINGDQRPDLLVANNNGHSVGVLLAQPQGGFELTDTVTTGVSPVSLGLADFDGDGIPDLATADALAGPTVVHGFGDGTFRAVPMRSLVNAPSNAVTGDFNRDGRLDVLVLDGDELSVLLGNGDGTLQLPAEYAPDAGLGLGSGVGAKRIAIADFDGDGALDVVSANSLVNTVSFARGNGTGGFLPPTNINAGTTTWRIASADVNNDGRPDIVLAGTTVADVRTLLNQGGGTFGSPITASGFSTSAFTDEIYVTDVSGDGKPDIVTGSSSAGKVQVAVGNGNGTFDAPMLYSAPFSALAFGDFDNDGKVDILVSNSSPPNDARLLHGTGGGAFTVGTAFTLANGAKQFAIADLNHDGKLDVVVANNLSSNVGVAFGRGDGTFVPAQRVAIAAQPLGLLLGDFTGDGRLDAVVVSDIPRTVTVLRGK